MNHRFAPLLSALVLAAASTPDPPDSAIWRRKHSRYQTTGNLILLFPGSRVASGMGSSARTARAANARRRSRRKIQRQSPLAKRRIRERVRHPRQGRLGVALGGRAETVMGLTGAGDLILTATGDLSRNRRVGLELARGRPLQAIVAGLGHVAEGVRSAHATLARASSRAVAMPITAAVNAVLEGSLTPQQAVELLLARDPRGE